MLFYWKIRTSDVYILTACTIYKTDTVKEIIQIPCIIQSPLFHYLSICWFGDIPVNRTSVNQAKLYDQGLLQIVMAI